MSEEIIWDICKEEINPAWKKNFIGIEKNLEYNNICKKRLKEDDRDGARKSN